MIFILSLIFYSFCPFSKPLGTVPSAQTTVGITITPMILRYLARSKYFSILLLFFIFTLLSGRIAKLTKRQILFFSSFICFCLIKRGLLFWVRLRDPFISQTLKKLYAIHSQGRILVSEYTILLYGKISLRISYGLNFLTSRACSFLFLIVYCIHLCD